jgi:Ca2+-binding EF-hand superfamily protein
VQKIFNQVSYEVQGEINYSDFLAATIRSKIKLGKETLWYVFSHYDQAQTGFISEENLYEAMIQEGHDVSVGEVKSILSELSLVTPGLISFAEF